MVGNENGLVTKLGYVTGTNYLISNLNTAHRLHLALSSLTAEYISKKLTA